jgi:vancomycin resistance protein YoaR
VPRRSVVAHPRWAALAALVLLLLLGYVGVAAWAGTQVREGTSVAGVDVGGLDRTRAAARLDRELGPRAQAPVRLRVGSATTTLRPADAGLEVDVAATARSLVGFSLRPGTVVRQLRDHGGPVSPVTRADPARLAAAVAQAAGTLDRDLVQGGIGFGPQGAVLALPAEGRRVDQRAAADAIRREWLGAGPVRLPGTVTEPRVSAAAMRRAYDRFARPAASGPLRLVVGDRRLTVPYALLAPTLSMRVTSGSPRLAVDGAALEKVVARVDPLVERPARDARLDVAGARPVVHPSRTGQRVDPDELAAAVLPALTRADRTATLRPAVVQPRTSTADVRRLGVREVVSTFTTRFPFNPPRTSNIRIAARTLDGTLVRPGETFSLNAALGRRTAAKGYRKAPVINGGRLETDFGGGVSQVSTTLFNAVFFAGLDTVEHKPHSFYISRYPEGREATVSYPTVDQKFRNDSGHGILIKTRVTASEITVTFWGTKVWDVDARRGPRTAVRPPRTIRDDDGTCVEQFPSPGFDVVVTRVFRRDGRQVRTERFRTRYIPEDRVVCG